MAYYNVQWGSLFCKPRSFDFISFDFSGLRMARTVKISSNQGSVFWKFYFIIFMGLKSSQMMFIGLYFSIVFLNVKNYFFKKRFCSLYFYDCKHQSETRMLKVAIDFSKTSCFFCQFFASLKIFNSSYKDCVI